MSMAQSQLRSRPPIRPSIWQGRSEPRRRDRTRSSSRAFWIARRFCRHLGFVRHRIRGDMRIHVTLRAQVNRHISVVVYMASFFYYESFLGLLVKWELQHGGLILKNLEYISESSCICILFFWSCQYKKKLFTCLKSIFFVHILKIKNKGTGLLGSIT